MDNLLTTEQIAKYLHLKPVTVRRKAARGEIPAIRIGKQLRFDKVQVDRWLYENKTGNSIKVLVVDDEAVVVSLIRDTLEMWGCWVTVTLSSPGALEIIGQQRFDLIFLDLIMPELDGSEVFKRIRELDNDVPVVIVTGYPDSDVMARAMEYGPFLVIKKPFSIGEVLQAVRMLNRTVGSKLSI